MSKVTENELCAALWGTIEAGNIEEAKKLLDSGASAEGFRWFCFCTVVCSGNGEGSVRATLNM